MPPQISLNELYSIGKKKQVTRTQCFDRVVELCHRRIRTIANYGGMNAFYEVPSVLLGFPLFSVADCTLYLVDALRKNGFLVQLLGATKGSTPVDGVVYVSWDPKEIRTPRPAIERGGGGGGPRAIPRPVKLF